MKVLKFGGTSLATSESMRKVVDIITKENAEIIVVSAPGRRFADDIKITDLLVDSFKARLTSGKCDVPFFEVEQRITALAEGVGVAGIKPYLDQIRHDINGGASMGYAMSRGEFLCALIMRHLLACEFMDASDIIRFDADGCLDHMLSYQKIRARLMGCRRVIIPGFYGATAGGEIRTFSRGGSDVTAAVIAAGVGASVYQNWTDVNGVFFCPLTDRCAPLSAVCFEDMRQLSYLGATVLHPASLLPLMEENIPLLIRNTFKPTACGTFVRSDCKIALCEVGCSDRKSIRSLTSANNASENDSIISNKTKIDSTSFQSDFTIDKSLDTSTTSAAVAKETSDDLPKVVESLPLAVSGRGGFKFVKVYEAGGTEKDYFLTVVENCRKKGAKIFTSVCGVDSYGIVFEGTAEGLEGECEDISVIVIVGGEKGRIIADVACVELPIRFLQTDFSRNAIHIGVPQEQLEPWLEKLCQLYSKNI